MNHTSIGSTTKKATIPAELTKKLVRRHGCDKKLPTETAEAISEVLRLFVMEARGRASIEAECDLEGAIDESDKEDNVANQMVSINGEHVTKIAAELLMDFS